MDTNTEPKPTVLVVYPYKFTEDHYRRYELEFFGKDATVVVWDTGYWIHPGFVRALSVDSSNRSCVVKIGSLLDLLRAYRRLGPKKHNQVVAFPHLRPTNFRELLCFLILKWRVGAFVEFLNVGVPDPDEELVADETEQLGSPALKKLKVWLSVVRKREYSKAMALLKSRSARVLASRLSVRPTHRLLAGRVMERTYRRASEHRGIRVVSGSSWDLSNSLARADQESRRPVDEPYAVLLDGAGPAYTSDVELKGDRPLLTSARWYPALVRCFDQWERELGIKIVVAGHPRTKYPEYPEEFGFRRVYYNCTEALVKHSEFVMMRFSTAVSYAVIYDKPALCLYNGQMEADAQGFRNFQAAVDKLGATPICVDAPPASIADHVKTVPPKYLQYRQDYLTTLDNPKPNYRIILENVAGHKGQE
jgi:hypothetical protein